MSLATPRMVASAAPPRVVARGIAKRFGALLALDDAALVVEPGTVHALLGENGAGKSTLAKCLVGTYVADAGMIEIDGRATAMRRPQDAHAVGLGMVYQHFSLVPCMTVLENLVASRPDAPRWIDWKRERAALDDFLDTMPFRVAPDAVVADLAAGERQKVEILKQLRLGHRVLFLDEPTSVLTPMEADALLGHLRALADARAISVVLTSHKLREVLAHATHVTVLRRGRVVADRPLDGALDAHDLAALMIGERPVAPVDVRRPPDLARPNVAAARLAVRDLRIARGSAGRDAVEREVVIDALDVHAGEIVGIAGVSGNGQRELVEALCGQRPLRGGAVTVDGRPWRPTRASMRAHGFACVPESPLLAACAPEMTLAENLALRRFDRAPIARAGRVRTAALRAAARELVDRFGVRAASVERPIRTLSGGNVQRAVLARELSGDVRLLVVANPCFGLDVRAVADIRTRLRHLRDAGAALLLVSEDLDEILELSDRVMVMFDGRVVFGTTRDTLDVRRIGLAMAGADVDEGVTVATP
jgi:simple sugar transport system ATP-binding protein